MINATKPSRLHFMIDAQSGDVLTQGGRLTTKNAIGFGGNLKTRQYNYSPDYDYFSYL